MRFRVTNIRLGYCEVWANTHDGGRYEQIASVKRLDNDGWHWAAKDYYILPEDNFVAQSTRRECIIDCKRTALLRQAQRAIDGGKGLSREHWHCPCRAALHDMQRSRLFSIVEMHEMRERMEASGKEQE